MRSLLPPILAGIIGIYGLVRDFRKQSSPRLTNEILVIDFGRRYHGWYLYWKLSRLEVRVSFPFSKLQILISLMQRISPYG